MKCILKKRAQSEWCLMEECCVLSVCVRACACVCVGLRCCPNPASAMQQKRQKKKEREETQPSSHGPTKWWFPASGGSPLRRSSNYYILLFWNSGGNSFILPLCWAKSCKCRWIQVQVCSLFQDFKVIFFYVKDKKKVYNSDEFKVTRNIIQRGFSD